MTVYFNAFPIIYTQNLPAALAFYRDLLGFRETFTFEGFVSLALDGGGGVALAAADDGTPGAHGRAMYPRGGPQFEMCIYTEDVDSAIGTLRERGVPVLVEPADQPWNERMAYVEDPDGHPVMICARLNGTART